MARWQLLDAGVSRHQVGTRLAAARLHELHRGVYLVGHEVPPPYALESAAILVCRGDAVLSHRSAAALWNLLPYPAPAPVCVTARPGRSPNRPRVHIHRAHLDRRDIRRHHGLPLTGPPRTILDLAAELSARALEAVVAEAEYRRLTSAEELADQLARNPRKRGGVALRRVLDFPGGPQRTRSPAERSFLSLLRRAGIDGFETNARIHGYEVDLLWRRAGLVVEIDGYDAHAGRVAFERDRLKNATLTAAGLRVMQVTGRQVRDAPEAVLSRLRDALA